MNITEKRRAEEFIFKAATEQQRAVVNTAKEISQPAAVTDALAAIAKQINIINRLGYDVNYFHAYGDRNPTLKATTDPATNKAYKKAEAIYNKERERISSAATTLIERVWADEIEMTAVLAKTHKGL
jgi:hypothetical protein